MANMTWKDLQKVVGELALEEQLRFAKLKRIEVPADVRAEHEQKQALAQIQLGYGSKRFPERVYLTFESGVPVGGLTKAGTPRVGSAPYMDIRTLDGEIARLTAARDALRQAGFPTGPCEPEKIPGIEVARQSGFTCKDNRAS